MAEFLRHSGVLLQTPDDQLPSLAKTVYVLVLGLVEVVGD